MTPCCVDWRFGTLTDIITSKNSHPLRHPDRLEFSFAPVSWLTPSGTLTSQSSFSGPVTSSDHRGQFFRFTSSKSFGHWNLKHEKTSRLIITASVCGRVHNTMERVDLQSRCPLAWLHCILPLCLYMINSHYVLSIPRTININKISTEWAQVARTYLRFCADPASSASDPSGLISTSPIRIFFAASEVFKCRKVITAGNSMVVSTLGSKSKSAPVNHHCLSGPGSGTTPLLLILSLEQIVWY